MIKIICPFPIFFCEIWIVSVWLNQLPYNCIAQTRNDIVFYQSKILISLLGLIIGGTRMAVILLHQSQYREIYKTKYRFHIGKATLCDVTACLNAYIRLPDTTSQSGANFRFYRRDRMIRKLVRIACCNRISLIAIISHTAICTLWWWNRFLLGMQYIILL